MQEHEGWLTHLSPGVVSQLEIPLANHLQYKRKVKAVKTLTYILRIRIWSKLMDYIIREMRSEEYCLLSDFLYEAIYIPEGIEPPPKSVIECPELQEYIVEFGNRKHDKALVAEIQGNVVGAIWVRIMNDYGHIDNDTPSLAMSVCPQYRGLGIGTSLLKQLLQVERLAGYSKISLSVQKSNYAVKMYEKVGFTVVNENSEEFIMIVNL